jgi:hydrogenase expression/formation protein HypE
MSDKSVISLAHGAGGRQMRELLSELVLTRFDQETPEGGVGLAELDDGAALPLDDGDDSVVVTTDSHVVTPLQFPGGDIGRLAVAGTVNDLAVMGATRPLALTCSLIVEEGTDRALLESVLDSMQATCEEAGCQVVTGDTKVMGSGEIDTLAINTTGVGVVPAGGHVPDAGLSPGDAIVVSGSVGDHGIALLSEREGFEFGGDLRSDVAPLNRLVEAALDAGRVTAMKDPTRGGLAGALNEMAQKAEVGIDLEESAIPVDGNVASAGEVLGIDPLSVANEGVVVFGVDAADAEAVVEAIADLPVGTDAAVVGTVTGEHPGRVVVDTGFGRRYLSEPEGEQLPRIC